MPNIDPLLERNKAFAATGAHERAGIVARDGVYVITCLDPRTDPAAFLGVGLGDAMVIRNAGGRVSPGVIAELAFVGYLSQTVLNPRRPAVFEVVIVHHTECGTRLLADTGFRAGFLKSLGMERTPAEDAALVAAAVDDPERTVRADVEMIRSSEVLPQTITVSGHVYDVATGLVTTIVPTSPMHSA